MRSLVVLAGLAAVTAWQPAFSQSLQARCKSLMEDSTSAMAADDLDSGARIAERWLAECKSLDAPLAAAIAYASAKWEHDDIAGASKAVENCIEMMYRYAGCHVTRARILIRQRKISEARKGAQDGRGAHRTSSRRHCAAKGCHDQPG
jgi:uncharacterized protein HemY